MIVIFTPRGNSFEVNYQGETFTKGDDTAHTIYAIVSDDSINSTNFQGFITFRREGELESSPKLPMAYGYVDYAGMKYKCFKFDMERAWYTAVAGTLATTIEIRQYLQTGAISNKAFGIINIPIQDSVVKDFDTSITKEEYNAMMKLIESLIVEANPNTTGNEEALLSLRVHNENFEIKRTLFNFSEAVTEATARILRQITIDGDVWKIPEFKIDTTINGTSLNAVANKAVKDYVDLQISKIKQAVAPDGTMSDTSANAVQNKVIKSYVDNLIKSTDTSLRTNINLVRQDVTNYAQNVEKVCKAYTDGKITRENLVKVIGEATSSISGLMSAKDKSTLDVLKSMLTQGDASVVDTIQEVLAIFARYPQGTDIVTLLAQKANKDSVYTKEETDAMAEALVSMATIGYTEV